MCDFVICLYHVIIILKYVSSVTSVVSTPSLKAYFLDVCVSKCTRKNLKHQVCYIILIMENFNLYF